MRRGAATRSLRSARGAAHSGVPRHAVGKQEGYDQGGRKDFWVTGEREAGELSGDWGSVWGVVWMRASRPSCSSARNGEARDGCTSTATIFA